MKERTYICCDLKSFYASVECVERGLDPMTTNLVVADKSRTEKTICLAVSPSLKAYGISGRARLFEVVQRVKEINAQRRSNAPGRQFTGTSWNDPEVQASPSSELDYLVAPPRMALYIEYSTRIYQVYLKYLAPEDIYPYSIDEVFMDVTDYLDTYNLTARQLAQKMILDVLETTGITAAAGMGENLYLAKIAMDIVAKHIQPDEKGVRIAKLSETTYRRLLWDHRPLTDFWRIGPGYAKKLEANGLYTMGDIARCSIGKETDYYNEELLYKLFGINAEVLIDHAWGWEPCTIADVKAYKPENKSVVSGQVLQYPYEFKKARLVVREMADMLSLDLVDKGLMTNQIVLTVGYDIENLSDPQRSKHYKSITAASAPWRRTARRRLSSPRRGWRPSGSSYCSPTMASACWIKKAISSKPPNRDSRTAKQEGTTPPTTRIPAKRATTTVRNGSLIGCEGSLSSIRCSIPKSTVTRPRRCSGPIPGSGSSSVC